MSASLRPFRREDVELYFTWMNDKNVLGDFVEREHDSLDTLLARFDETQFFGPEEWFYIWEGEDGSPMGFAHWWKCDKFEEHLEFGRILVPPYRGKGLGTEFLRQIVEKIFSTTSTNRVQAITACGNDVVLRQWARVGIQKEGVLRSFMTVKDTVVDCCIGSILREEWNGL